MSFTHERTLIAHACEMRTRHENRDQKYVKTAYWAYCKFYEITYGVSYMKRTTKTPESFMKSKLYTAFVRFGKYILEINAINPLAFLQFLLQNKIPIDGWIKPHVYDTYVRELSKKESADAALTRNFLLMEQWSVSTGLPWTDFFRKIEPGLAVLWIRSGRISPWVIYTAPSFADLMGKMSPEQINLIQTAIEPDFWGPKLQDNADEVDHISNILEETGL